MHNAIFAGLVTLQGSGANTGSTSDTELSLWNLMVEASAEVQVLLLVLVLMALGSWFIIGAKLLRFAQATSKSSRFLDMFWQGEQGSPWSADRLEGIYGQLPAYKGAPLANVFRAGYVELARVAQQPEQNPQAGGSAGDVDNVERALRRAASNEITGLETLLPFLATTGSTAPFVGLLGTVLGIIRTFVDLHGQQSANLDVVLPGIAEALIATAVGLFAAIPAVMAYNYFVRRLRVLESELDAFSSDYLNIVRRYFLRG
jgi:biopolymer transport protein TolQ